MSEQAPVPGDPNVSPQEPVIPGLEYLDDERVAASSMPAQEVTPPVVAAAEATSTERSAEEYEAKEVLKTSQIFRTDVREGVGKTVTVAERTVAQAENLASSPKNAVLGLRHNRAKRKYDRISEKQDQSRFDFVNRRRDTKAAKAFDKLQRRDSTLQSHNNLRQGRLDRVANRGKERIEGVDRRRAELAKKTIAAEQRKIDRAVRRDERQRLIQQSKEGDTKLTHKERERLVAEYSRMKTTENYRAAIRSLRRDGGQADARRGEPTQPETPALAREAVEQPVPSAEEVISFFANQRSALRQKLGEIQAKPGFGLTVEGLKARREEEATAQQELDNFERGYAELGGTELDSAQEAVDALDFRSDASERVRAQKRLRSAQEQLHQHVIERLQANSAPENGGDTPEQSAENVIPLHPAGKTAGANESHKPLAA